METAFKYFEANEIFPTRAEFLEKYEARVKGITPSKPAPEKKKKVIYLTKEEMKRILNLDLKGEHAYLEIVRDIFIFCCFSSL